VKGRLKSRSGGRHAPDFSFRVFGVFSMSWGGFFDPANPQQWLGTKTMLRPVPRRGGIEYA